MQVTPLLLSLVVSLATAAPTALVGATVHPVSGPPIPDGVVLFDGPTLTAVGPRGAVEIPSDATVRALPGRHIIPGLIDLHSHIGGGRLHESLGPVQGGISAIDAIDPTHISIQRAQAGGVTLAQVMPGSGKLLGGQTALLRLTDASVVDDMLLCSEPPEGATGPLRRVAVCGGVKMAGGTNPQGSGSDPRSRMGATFLQREALLAARDRRDAQDRRAAALASPRRRDRQHAPPAPDPDPAADGLVEILRGERTVHFHSHRADDIVGAVRLQQELGFGLVIHHGSEGFKVADLLAEADIPVAINVLDTPGGKEETLERRFDNPAILHAAGVRVAIITDDPVQDSRLLLRSAGLAARGGLPLDVALRALTRTPAELLAVEDRKGSLEPGLDADLVVLSGPPLSSWTLVEETWVEGARVFDRADPRDRAHATGGDAALAPPPDVP